MVITRASDDLSSNVRLSTELPSNHSVIKGRLSVPRPTPTKIFVNHRKLRNIDSHAFRNSIQESTLTTEPCTDVYLLVHQYNSNLANILDMHAPQRPRFMTIRPHAPWFVDSLRQAKVLKRKYERKYRSSGLEIDKQIFLDHCAKYNSSLTEAKTTYHRKRFEDCDQRTLFREVNSMAKGKSRNPLPTSLDNPADQFSAYFNGKIQKLCNNLSGMSVPALKVEISPDHCKTTFSSFATASRTHIEHVVKNSPTKSCELDPIPTVIVKEHLDVLLKPIMNIVNLSFSSGVMPDSLKVSQVVPVIKKSTMDPEEMCSFRPISNLPFVSKSVEHVVARQLFGYLMDNNIYPKLQSAYRQRHSTETALLRVHNDLMVALDSGNQALLVLLDFSAAFDTIDHKILISRLENRFGVAGIPLSWFQSYLQSRTQYVKVNGKASASTPLQQGVPQGSVLGPLLFSLYAAPLEDILTAHGVDGMIFADDTQLYITLKESNTSTTVHQLECCVHDIRYWCISNKLFLNDSKTEFLHISPRKLNQFQSLLLSLLVTLWSVPKPQSGTWGLSSMRNSR